MERNFKFDMINSVASYLFTHPAGYRLSYRTTALFVLFLPAGECLLFLLLFCFSSVLVSTNTPGDMWLFRAFSVQIAACHKWKDVYVSEKTMIVKKQ